MGAHDGLSRWLAVLAMCTGFAGAAHALDWRPVGTRTREGTTVHLDIDSLRKQPDGFYAVSVLFDEDVAQRAVNGAAYFSQVRDVRIDCKGERLADQRIVMFAGHAAKGAAVHRMERSASEANADMEAAAPQSTGQGLVWAVCELAVRGRPPGQ